MPLITSFNGNDIKQSTIVLNGIENIKQESTSTRKIQHEQLGMETISKAWMPLITSFNGNDKQQHQTINNHAQWHQKHQTAINLNQKNSTLHLLQVNNNIRGQESVQMSCLHKLS